MKIDGKKYNLYEEKKTKNVEGVIEIKKMKITWAYMCYLTEQIKEFLDSDEEKRVFNQSSY